MKQIHIKNTTHSPSNIPSNVTQIARDGAIGVMERAVIGEFVRDRRDRANGCKKRIMMPDWRPYTKSKKYKKDDK